MTEEEISSVVNSDNELQDSKKPFSVMEMETPLINNAVVVQVDVLEHQQLPTTILTNNLTTEQEEPLQTEQLIKEDKLNTKEQQQEEEITFYIEEKAPPTFSSKFHSFLLNSWSTLTNNKNHPYSESYMKYNFLLAAIDTQNAIEKFMLYFLFGLSSYQCNFSTVFGMNMIISGIISIITQPVCGIIVDRFKHVVNRFLSLTALCQLLCEIGMVISALILTNTFACVVIVIILQIIRQFFTTMNLNAFWKIVKMKMTKHHEDDIVLQDFIVNKIGVYSDLIAELYEVGSLFVTFMLFSFSVNIWIIQFFIYAVVIFWTIVTIIISLSINQEEFFTTTVYEIENNETTTNNEEQVSEERVIIEDDLKHNPSAVSIHTVNPGTSTNMINLNKQVTKDNLQKRKEPKKFKSFLTYLKEGFIHLVKNPIGRCAFIHSTCIFFFNYLSMTALPLSAFTLPKEATFETYCGGYFTNIFEQALYMNIAFIPGAVLYLLILTRFTPIFFFRYGSTSLITILLMLTIILWIFPTIAGKAVLIAIIQVLSYYIFRFGNLLATSAVDVAFYGLFASLFGFVKFSLVSIIGLLVNLDYHVQLIICTCVLCFVFLFSIIVSIVDRKRMKEQENKRERVNVKIN
ncbi:hypothetical protein ABK040_004457 [Willaertia magna]